MRSFLIIFELTIQEKKYQMVKNKLFNFLRTMLRNTEIVYLDEASSNIKIKTGLLNKYFHLNNHF
jgi:hypothetical protein